MVGERFRTRHPGHTDIPNELAETQHLELQGSAVDLRLVNPGFVATQLTAKNNFKMPTMLTPGQSAEQIIRGLQRNGFEIALSAAFVAWLKLARLLPYR